MPARPAAKIELLAAAVAGGTKVSTWCAANNVPPRTAYGWTRREEFKQRVKALQSELVAQALSRLVGTSSQAAATLRRLLKSESDKVALGASVNILKLLMDLQSHAQLSDRITELERKLNEQQKH